MKVVSFVDIPNILLIPKLKIMSNIVFEFGGAIVPPCPVWATRLGLMDARRQSPRSGTCGMERRLSW